MFENNQYRSIDYNDRSLSAAINQIKRFEANLGVANLHNALDLIFKGTKPKQVKQTHMYLLTDGAESDLEKLSTLIESHATMT